MRLTFFHPSGYLRKPEQSPYGKDVANAGLFSALTHHLEFEALHVLHHTNATAEDLAPQFCCGANQQTPFHSAPLWNTSLSQRSGNLLRGAADLSSLAWGRRQAWGDHGYSLTGLIHTLGPPMIREQIIASLSAPVQPWDALICTSPAVQGVVSSFFDQQEAWLQERFGASRMPRPQLPLIPLGVNAAEQAARRANSASRQQLRQQLGLNDDAVLALWVGRLSFYEKAFPQAMLQAVERANQASKHPIHLALCGWFPDPSDQRLFENAIQHLSSTSTVHVLNGSDPSVVGAAWAAADLFVSLVDNIQETFGLTPIEAMAAGLPVVVSDWDGYRFTVRDGEDGFLIPTLLSPASDTGALLGHLHNLQLESYQTYAGATAQHTAVHIEQAAAAIQELADSPALRQRLGEAGQQRARARFDWPVIVRSYQELLLAQQEQRLHSQAHAAAASPTRQRPGRADPFADFAPFATSVLHDELQLQRAGSTPLNTSLQVQLNRLYPGIRGSNAEAQQLLTMLEQGAPQGLSVAALMQAFAPEREAPLKTTLVWLIKQGLIRW